MSDTGEKYFQFPLCALAFGANEVERLNHIIPFGCADAGGTMLNRLRPEIRTMKADELATASGTPADYRKTKFDHVAFALGARELNVRFSGQIAHPLKQSETLLTFKTQFEAKHGRDVEARIATRLVFEVRDKAGMSYRELAVLCAIYSCIGAKSYPVRITRERIQCRMLGYKSPAIMQAELANRTDGAKPLSLRQINYTLDALHERQFFARARANERQTFYSHRMSQDELEARLITGKSYSETFHNQRRQRDAELMRKIKQGKAAIKADTTIKVDTANKASPNVVHSASTTASAGVSAECSL